VKTRIKCKRENLLPFTSATVIMSVVSTIPSTYIREMTQISELTQRKSQSDSVSATFVAEKYECAIEDEPEPEPTRYVRGKLQFVLQSQTPNLATIPPLRIFIAKTTVAYYRCRPRAGICKEQRRSRTLAPPLRWRGETLHDDENEENVGSRSRY